MVERNVLPTGLHALQAYCFASMAVQSPQPSLSEDKYVALVSGLGLGDDAGDPLKLSLLVDYLVGSLASNEEQTRISQVQPKNAPLQQSLLHLLCCMLPYEDAAHLSVNACQDRKSSVQSSGLCRQKQVTLTARSYPQAYLPDQQQAPFPGLIECLDA